ncbi:DDE Tnp4 domain-containing protein [Citrus sinensis]|nr:DDE Tnp4 domain-containing protein [Citrus sinensis]
MGINEIYEHASSSLLLLSLPINSSNAKSETLNPNSAVCPLMGMHIPVMVRVDERGPFRNQSGLLSAKRKHYLVDNKYANMPGFIAPYQGVPYRTNQIPSGYHRQDAKELFNQRYSSLRNGQFTILLSAPPCPLQTQVKLVVVACALHNYTRREKPDDWLFRMYEEDTLLPTAESLHPL